MGSNNGIGTIPHPAKQDRLIPVLIDSAPEKADGFVASKVWGDKPVTMVQRLLPSFLKNLKNPQRLKEIEQIHGKIGSAEWTRLRGMHSLIDRLNSGDWSPILSATSGQTEELLLIQAARVSPREERSGRATQPRLKRAEETDDYSVLSGIEINGKIVSPILTLMEAFTAGLSRTRFVVWWSDDEGKLGPGLYCPDILTGLYALAMWSSGNVGGWTICQRCRKGFTRRRAKQLYCSHRCQVAAAMQRHRHRLKSTKVEEDGQALWTLLSE